MESQINKIIINTQEQSESEPSLINTPNKEPGKVLIQQTFHRSMFGTRPRSNSTSTILSIIPSDDLPKKSVSTDPVDRPEWQRIPTKKRKFAVTSPTSNSEKIPLTNRFASLPVDQENTQPKINRPPQIILYGIEDVNKLTGLLESVVDSAQFRYKIVNKNLLRILVDNPEAYKRVIDTVRQKGLIGHTFSRKDTKCFRIVIRNLHFTTPHEAIIQEIEKTGNKVSGEIINARYGPEKKPTSTFFVNLEPNVNNKAVKTIKHIYHQQVLIEDPRKSSGIVQCQRCQQYGHSKNNCMRPFRCVKCGEGHKTSDCSKKDRNTPAKCALCSCDHPANYKGCQVYKEILARKTNKAQARPRNRITEQTCPKSIPEEFPPPKTPIPQHVTASATSTGNKRNDPITTIRTDAPKNTTLYSDVIKNTPVTQHTQLNSLESILIKQNEKMECLLQQISTLLSLMTTIITKLTA